MLRNVFHASDVKEGSPTDANRTAIFRASNVRFWTMKEKGENVIIGTRVSFLSRRVSVQITTKENYSISIPRDFLVSFFGIFIPQLDNFILKYRFATSVEIPFSFVDGSRVSLLACLVTAELYRHILERKNFYILISARNLGLCHEQSNLQTQLL